MSDGQIYCFFVPDVDDEVLLDLLQLEQWTWLFAERMETTELMFLSDALACDVPMIRWQHGRVFGDYGELAWWRREDNHSDLRLLAPDQQPRPGPLSWGQGTPWQPAGEPQETILHGTLDDEVVSSGEARWSEARIPRWLFHPIPLDEEATPPDRVSLLAQPYAQGGIVGLTCLIAVTGVDNEEQNDGV